VIGPPGHGELAESSNRGVSNRGNGERDRGPSLGPPERCGQKSRLIVRLAQVFISDLLISAALYTDTGGNFRLVAEAWRPLRAALR
jgi:hypothetical protein